MKDEKNNLLSCENVLGSDCRRNFQHVFRGEPSQMIPLQLITGQKGGVVEIACASPAQMCVPRLPPPCWRPILIRDEVSCVFEAAKVAAD